MVRQYSSTAVETTLASSINASVGSIDVDSTSGFPVLTPYTLSIDAETGSKELVEVTSVAGTTLTVTRGIDGTSGVSHSIGAVVRHDHSARDFREPQEHIAATTDVHGATGALVDTGSTQALTNKDLSSGTNTFPASLVTLSTAQTLTNKDLSDASNTFPASLATDAEVASAVSTHAALTTGTHGVGAGSVMGTTLTQAVTNKDLTSNTNSFPSSLATLTGAQTLTNKTLDSPTITSPVVSGLGHSDQKVLSADATATSGAYVNMSSLDMSVTVNDPSDVVWVNLSAEIAAGTANTLNQIELLVDGVDEAVQLRTRLQSVNDRYSAAKTWRLTGLAAGAHALTFRTRNASGSSSVTVVADYTVASYWTNA